MTLFLFIAVAFLAVSLWYSYQVFFKYDKSRKFFGLTRFWLMILMAIGSSGHYVESDFERIGSDYYFGISLAASGVCTVGAFAGLIKWFINRRPRNSK
jgi:hypothetical protein